MKKLTKLFVIVIAILAVFSFAACDKNIASSGQYNVGLNSNKIENIVIDNQVNNFNTVSDKKENKDIDDQVKKDGTVPNKVTDDQVNNDDIVTDKVTDDQVNDDDIVTDKVTDDQVNDDDEDSDKIDMVTGGQFIDYNVSLNGNFEVDVPVYTKFRVKDISIVAINGDENIKAEYSVKISNLPTAKYFANYIKIKSILIEKNINIKTLKLKIDDVEYNYDVKHFQVRKLDDVGVPCEIKINDASVIEIKPQSVLGGNKDVNFTLIYKEDVELIDVYFLDRGAKILKVDGLDKKITLEKKVENEGTDNEKITKIPVSKDITVEFEFDKSKTNLEYVSTLIFEYKIADKEFYMMAMNKTISSLNFDFVKSELEKLG